MLPFRLSRFTTHNLIWHEPGCEERDLRTAGCGGRLDKGAVERARLFVQISSRRVPALGFAGLARGALAAGGSGLRAAVVGAERCFQVSLLGRVENQEQRQGGKLHEKGRTGGICPGEKESGSEFRGSRVLPAHPRNPHEAASLPLVPSCLSRQVPCAITPARALVPGPGSLPERGGRSWGSTKPWGKVVDRFNPRRTWCLSFPASRQHSWQREAAGRTVACLPTHG